MQDHWKSCKKSNGSLSEFYYIPKYSMEFVDWADSSDDERVHEFTTPPD